MSRFKKALKGVKKLVAGKKVFTSTRKLKVPGVAKSVTNKIPLKTSQQVRGEKIIAAKKAERLRKAKQERVHSLKQDLINKKTIEEDKVKEASKSWISRNPAKAAAIGGGVGVAGLAAAYSLKQQSGDTPQQREMRRLQLKRRAEEARRRANRR